MNGVHTPLVDFLAKHLNWLMDDMVPDGEKIGMVGSVEVVEAVVEFLEGIRRREKENSAGKA